MIVAVKRGLEEKGGRARGYKGGCNHHPDDDNFFLFSFHPVSFVGEGGRGSPLLSFPFCSLLFSWILSSFLSGSLRSFLLSSLLPGSKIFFFCSTKPVVGSFARVFRD